MLGESLNHVSAVESLAQDIVEQQQHLAHLVLQGEVHELEVVVAVEHVQVFYHLLVGDVALAEAGSLVEDGEGISHTSVCLLGDDGKRLLLVLDAFLLSHHLEVGDGVGYGHALEVVNLASTQDGRQDLVLLGGGEDEDHVRWRLLQGLEKGIEGGGTQHVDLVDDEHLVFAYLRRDAGLLHQGLDLIDTIVAGGIQLEDVVGALLIESLTALAGIACLAVLARVLAVDCLGKDAGTGGLSHTSRTAEKISVGKLATLHCILQCGSQRTLSNHRIKGHRTVFSSRNYVFFHSFLLEYTFTYIIFS